MQLKTEISKFSFIKNQKVSVLQVEVIEVEIGLYSKISHIIDQDLANYGI